MQPKEEPLFFFFQVPSNKNRTSHYSNRRKINGSKGKTIIVFQVRSNKNRTSYYSHRRKINGSNRPAPTICPHMMDMSRCRIFPVAFPHKSLAPIVSSPFPLFHGNERMPRIPRTYGIADAIETIGHICRGKTVLDIVLHIKRRRSDIMLPLAGASVGRLVET